MKTTQVALYARVSSEQQNEARTIESQMADLRARIAATGADLLYTDVWISMGKEAESQDRLAKFEGYQINGRLLKVAKPDALIMHCLPAYRGKEIDEETFEANAQTIFDEAENRLHAQKAILSWIVA